MVRNYKEVLYDNKTLTTKRLVLRAFTKSDVRDVFEYGSDPETLKFLNWGGVDSPESAMASLMDFNLTTLGVFAIELKETKKCIGCININLIPEHEKASFGYVLNRNYWNMGFMTEVLTAVLRFCFEKLELNRVEAEHYAGNEGSGKVMQKCGMKLEGIGIQEVKSKGVFRDTAHYGITREQWIGFR